VTARRALVLNATGSGSAAAGPGTAKPVSPAARAGMMAETLCTDADGGVGAGVWGHGAAAGGLTQRISPSRASAVGDSPAPRATRSASS